MALPALEIEITADTSGADVGLKKLERSMDGLEGATREYQAALSRVNRAERAGLVTSKQAAAAIRQAERAYESAAASAARYSGAQVAARRSATGLAGTLSGLSTQTRGMGGGIQNVAFQVGDFATQVGAGTSASIALGQQLPQLLGGFGALGAAAGAVVAIGVPLAASFLRSAENAGTLADQIDGLTEAIDALNSAQSNASQGVKDLRDEFGQYSAQVQEALRLQRDLAALEAQSALSETVRRLSGAFGDLSQTVDDAGQMFGGYERTFRRIIRDFDTGAAEAQNLISSLNDLGAAQGPEAQASAVRNVRLALIEATGGVAQMDDETREVYQSLLEAEIAAARVAQIDFATNIGAGADEGERLADALERAATRARIIGGRSGVGRDDAVVLDPRDPRYDPIAAAMESMEYTGPEISVRSPRGGGGGAASQPDRIGALARSLMTETEVLENWREDSLAKLAEFNALELEALGGHNEAKLRLEEEYQSRLDAIRRAERDATLGGYQALFGSLADVFQQGNEKALRISKAFALAEAGVSIARGAAKALELPFPANLGAWATVISTGAQALQSIRSASPGNAGTLTAGGGGGGAVAAQAAPSPLEVRLTGLGANDLLTGADVGSLLERLTAEAGDRGLRLTVAR